MYYKIIIIFLNIFLFSQELNNWVSKSVASDLERKMSVVFKNKNEDLQFNIMKNIKKKLLTHLPLSMLHKLKVHVWVIKGIAGD